MTPSLDAVILAFGPIYQIYQTFQDNENQQTFSQNFDGINLTIKQEAIDQNSHTIRLTVIDSPFGRMNNYNVTRPGPSEENVRQECLTAISKRVDEVYCRCCKFFCKYFCCGC